MAKREFKDLSKTEQLKRLSANIERLTDRRDNAKKYREEAIKRFDENTAKIPKTLDGYIKQVNEIAASLSSTK